MWRPWRRCAGGESFVAVARGFNQCVERVDEFIVFHDGLQVGGSAAEVSAWLLSPMRERHPNCLFMMQLNIYLLCQTTPLLLVR